MTMTPRVPLALALAALISVLPSVLAMDDDESLAPEQQTVKIRRAHAFTYQDINPNSSSYGERLALAEIYAERGVVLNFLASWCPPCWAEIPGLQRFGADAPTPLIFVAADEHGPIGDVIRRAKSAGIQRPILHVPKSEISAMETYYDHELLPSTYLIDREGTILQIFQGVVTEADLSRAVQQHYPADG